MIDLLDDLFLMGESNALIKRKEYLRKDISIAANSIYKSILTLIFVINDLALYGNKDGSINATFNVINCIGWKYSETQPASKKRGSAKVSLKEKL